jgi:Family of unknown function (DUF6166)
MQPHNEDVLYRGDAVTGQVIVYQDGSSAALDPRLDLHRYADQFRWGADAAGTLQLALALLSHALESDRRAFVLHEPFAASVVSRLTPDYDWMLSRSFIERTVLDIESVHDLNWMKPQQTYLEELIQ